ncbi:MAG: AIPR family protein [Treponemataceae bacterium]|nr:AIPR family protein [Treponemataceae bacterium]
MNDRLIKSCVDKFVSFTGITEDDETKLFEHFVNYTLVYPKSENQLEVEDILNINIGAGGTIGLDGFVIIVNNQLVFTEEDLLDSLSQNSKVDIIFIQSKTSPSFSLGDISIFGGAVSDFISDNHKMTWSNNGKEKISLFESFVSRIMELEEKPNCFLYYVTTGRDDKDTNIYNEIDNIKKRIIEENLFSDCKIELVDSSSLQKKYTKLTQKITNTIEFKNKITLPAIEGVKEAFLGLVNAKTIISLITDEQGNLIHKVFYDNIRDFQGTDNKVNTEIQDTINSDYRDSFSIMNNGITIVAEESDSVRDNYKITNYQIINGCQTSHVLYNNKDKVDDSIQVPLKLIITKNQKLMERVIWSTNRQSAVTEQDLMAFSKFQRELEEYYKTFPEGERLYYERRSKQFDGTSISKTKIVDKLKQVKSVSSFFEDNPAESTRYIGKLIKASKGRLFLDSHYKEPYYVSTFAFYKLDQLFRNRKIDKKYKKIRYYVLAMLRHELNNGHVPSFESKKVVKYCDNILPILKNDDELLKKVQIVLSKIDKLGFDLNSNEISKSKTFENACLGLYLRKKS